MSLTSRVTDDRLKRRYRAEARFKGYCIVALLLAMTFLVVFFFDIIRQGYPAFYRAEIQTQITYSERSVEIPWQWPRTCARSSPGGCCAPSPWRCRTTPR